VEWLDELRHAADERQGPLIAQLATVDAAGRPRVRSIVVRHIADNGTLAACSDRRSRKNGELRHNACTEWHFWFEPQRLQFRLLGRCDVLNNGPLAARVWAGLSPTAKTLFVWPPSGAARADDAAFVDTYDGPPPATFEVLRLRPVEVERLDLINPPHRRRIWRATNAWRGNDINP
jgi:hypothetical protein